jgi:hypothetical protein
MLQKILSRKKKTQSWKELAAEIKQAQRDPEFMKEVDKFIKVTS